MDLPVGWTANTARVNGAELQYYRTGGGPTLVLAHGFYSNSRCWERLAADLADDFELMLYDARGHGGSEATETGYGIEDRVGDLVGLIEELSLENPVLVGHSMGGSTAAWTAAMHPTLPRAIVLEDPAGMHGPPDTTPEERERMVRETVHEWDNASMQELVAEHDEYEPSLARRLAVACTECRPEIAAIPREGYPSLEAAFPDIDCPTLVLKADADPETRVTDLDRADGLSDGRLVHIPDAGHCVLRDEYDAAYAEIRTFLRRLPSDPDAER